MTDTEIKIGQTSAYSGPARAYGTLGKTEVAYERMTNEARRHQPTKINLISLDDGDSPTQTVEQTRRLVGQDQVLGIFHSLGTATSSRSRSRGRQLSPTCCIIKSDRAFGTHKVRV